ncbi:MAG TPA: hypothetical protein EYH50_02570 [Pyrodictium delaneyi]|uniref:Uncharacterized protein n=1 Tax=Pyrodictium delaneyi TaxID=1273541 RepID=A0A832ZUG1_9CREN|nr:hypothetical protein [Pyrodictium delaneyi]
MVQITSIKVSNEFCKAPIGSASVIDAYDSPIETIVRLSCKSIGLNVCRKTTPSLLRVLRLIAMDLYAVYSGLGLDNVVVEEQRHKELGTVLIAKRPGCGAVQLDIEYGDGGVMRIKVSCGKAIYECNIKCQ